MTARRRNIGLAVMVALAALWLVAASRVHVNASWSDGAWGYAAFLLFGAAPKIGDRVLFEPPEALGSPVPYLKTVRGLPGMTVAFEEDGDGHGRRRPPRPGQDACARRATAHGHRRRDDPGRPLLPARRPPP